MKTHPMLFSAPMLRALVHGRKTQTRRLLKIKGYPDFFQFGHSDTPGYDWNFRRKDHVWEDYEHERLLELLPIQAGDLIWVREKWAAATIWPIVETIDKPMTVYADCDNRTDYGGPWKPSIHMKRCDSRFTLRVTDVRIQQLQAISEPDAIAEGIEHDQTRSRGNTIAWRDYLDRGGKCGTPRGSFQSLWDSINAHRTPWASNPWVTAYTFEVLHQNVDQLRLAA